MLVCFIHGQVPASGPGGSAEWRAGWLPTTAQGTSLTIGIWAYSSTLTLSLQWHSLSVMTFDSFRGWIIFRTLYCLSLSFILFSNTVMTHFLHISFIWSNWWKISCSSLFSPSFMSLNNTRLSLWGVNRFSSLGGNCVCSQNRVTIVINLSGLVTPLSSLVILWLCSQRAASSRTASRVCRRGTSSNPEKEPSKDFRFTVT